MITRTLAAVAVLALLLGMRCTDDPAPPVTNQQTGTTADLPSAADANAFLHRLMKLSDRLAARNIVVSRLMCDWAGFGNWEIEVADGAAFDKYSSSDDSDAPGPDVIRFFWDGRDNLLTVESSPTRPLRAPNEWKVQLTKTFDDESQALAFIEPYLEKRFR